MKQRTEDISTYEHFNCVHSKRFITVNDYSNLSYPVCSDSVRSDEKDC